MIVEKPDALKQWMADILEHMSDAQPTKLARYVLALVRKASSPERLRTTMLEQLDVFLHEETPLFADRLLAALASGAYAVRPAESRVVTLPAAPPPRRLVQLPPEETNSSPGAPAVSDRLGDKTNGTTDGIGSPARPNSNGMNASSRDSHSSAGNSTTNGTSAPASADPRPDARPNARPDARPDARPSPFTDLRHRLGGSLGRRRGRDANERSTDDSPSAYSPAKVTAPGGPAPLAPFSQPQPPPAAAAAAEPSHPEPIGQTVCLSSLPAASARQQVSALPSQTASVDQSCARPLDTCSLHLKEIPPHLNQIMPLNDYMSEFGRVVNIQVSFGCDPSAALVTFDSSEEAAAALSSPKPVLGCAQVLVRPHGDRAAFGGRQMALSGLKRTVANPDAARRKSELDSVSQASHLPQNNGDTALAYPDDSPAASQEQDSADDQPSAPEVWQVLPQSQQQDQTSAGLPTEETAEARRQNQEIVEARRQEIRRSQDLLAANVALEAKRKEKREAARRLAAELQRREADLLQRQLEQQRHLLARLDSPGLRPAERQALLGALRALQAASQSTRAGLTAALERGAAPRPAPAPAHRAPLRRAHPADGREAGTTDQPAAKLAAGLPQETEREVLDLELALYQRQLAGAETEELQQRLSHLRQAAVPTRGRGRGARARGRGRGGAGRGAVPGRFSSIDRRPTTLIVSDFAAVGRAATVAHLTRFGEVTDCRPAGDTGAALAVTFGTRRQAEAALAGGATVGVHRLTLGWPLSSAAAAAAKAASDVQIVEMDTGADQAVDADIAESPTNLSDFEDDEGDDADDEDDRSWRP